MEFGLLFVARSNAVSANYNGKESRYNEMNGLHE